MNFHSLYDQGFARVAAVTLPAHPARPAENAREIIDAARELDARGVAVAVFPELSVSGYAIDDLLLQDVLLDNVEKALATIVEASTDLLPLLIVGAPLRKDNALYNCAVAIHRGRVLAIVPKSHLPNYREFYEKRHFVTMPPHACERIEVPWGGVDDLARVLEGAGGVCGQGHGGDAREALIVEGMEVHSSPLVLGLFLRTRRARALW